MSVGSIQQVHSDHRRDIQEYNGLNFSINTFFVKEECRLGDHYHTFKSETFVIIEGGGLVLLQFVTQADGQTHAASEMLEYQLEPGSVVHIEPYQAHTFILKAGSKMICYVSAPFDENNMDMQTFKIEGGF